MKVKMLGIWASPTGNYKKDDVLEVSEEVGKCLVAQRAAEVIECVALPKIPTVADTTPVEETATVQKELHTADRKKRMVKR